MSIRLNDVSELRQGDHKLASIMLQRMQAEAALTDLERKEDCSRIAGNVPSSTVSEICELGQASLRILRATSEFEELRDLWSAWTDGPEADLDLFSLHVRHRREAVRPHVIVVYRNGRPDCMLVGWLDRGPVDFKVGSSNLFRSDARILRFVNGGFLGNQSRGNARFLVHAITKSLHRREAQAAQFSQLRTDSTLYDLAKRGPSRFCRDYFTPAQAHWYLTVPAGFDEFFRGLTARRRNEFKRHARLLARDFPGRVRFEIVRSEREVEDFARKADGISQQTYKRAMGVGFVNNLEMREMLRAAAQKAGFRASLLYVDERPIAFAAGTLSNRTLYATFTGFDPEFRKYAPGLQSILHLIEKSSEQNGSLVRLDAGCGDMPYKRALFSSSWKEAPVWIFAPSAKGLRLHVLKLVSTLLHSLALRSLAKSERLQKIKKAWHEQALRNFHRESL